MRSLEKVRQIFNRSLLSTAGFEPLIAAIAAELIEAERCGMLKAADIAEAVTALNYGGIQKRAQIVVAIRVAAGELNEHEQRNDP